jgi:hypothetical protein
MRIEDFVVLCENCIWSRWRKEDGAEKRMTKDFVKLIRFDGISEGAYLVLITCRF